MATLPVSQLGIAWRESTTAMDLALREQPAGLRGAVATASALAITADPATDGHLDVGALPVADLDALVVELRRAVIGDHLVGEGACGACRSTVDLRFDLRDYLAHLAPRRTRAAVESPEPGWWALSASTVSFRLPTVDDVLDAPGGRTGRARLVTRCLRGEPTAAEVRRAERAMAALGPMLRSTVTGHCPECEVPVDLDFDAREFCLRELQARAASVLADIDLIARTYSWSEREILALPSRRRTAYVELILAGAPAGTRSGEALVA